MRQRGFWQERTSWMDAARRSPGARRKLVEFDPETWHALDLLARDSMKSIQELADEAFRDLLRKHGRPTDLKTALRRSAGEPVTASQPAPAGKRRRKRT
jgi:hypothetical protein